jgi:hypothetical protein
MGHMGMIMDAKNSNVEDEEIINCKCNCRIIAKTIRANCK